MEQTRTIFLSPSVQQFNVGYGDYGTEEYRMNRITNYVENLLKQEGYTVYRNDKEDTLKQVVQKSNDVNPAIHVSIHSNASGSPGAQGRGPEIYVRTKGSNADKLAGFIYDNLLDIYPDKSLGKGVKYTTNLYELNKTRAPAVLIEVAFHDNKEDAAWIMQNEENIAKAIVKGINEYFNS